MPLEVATKFKTEGQSITATAADASAQVLYTCPNNYSGIVKFLNISAGTLGNKKISVQIYHDETAQYDYLLNTHDMSAHSTFNVLSGNTFSLHQKDKIVAFTNSANNFDIVISVDEYFDPVRK
jgi:hypothetical protein